MTGDVVRAAGGVVVTNGANGQVRLVLVHRPLYDDWTLPKGKCEEGEAAEDCAVREVEEETSLRCHLLGLLPSTSYIDRKGRPKEVRWWLMRPESGDLLGRFEVDIARWVTPEEALALLTYERDRDLLEPILRETKLWLIRHADAGERADWEEPDQLRPLTARGRRQAEQLARLLARERIDRLVSSPYVRCVQTLEPLGSDLGLAVDRSIELGEGHGLDGIEPLLLGGRSVAACTHGDVLEALLDELRHDGLAGTGARAPKASAWKLRARAGLFQAAEYIPPP